VTEILHVPDGARGLGHASAALTGWTSLKSSLFVPAICGVMAVRGVVPLFVRVIDWASPLVTPFVALVKLKLEGFAPRGPVAAGGVALL